MKLSTKRIIKIILQKGERQQAGPLTFFILPADKKRGAQLGIMIAKKRYRKSVDRNRIKRLIRESLRNCAGHGAGGPFEMKYTLVSVGSGLNTAQLKQRHMDSWINEYIRSITHEAR